MDTLKTAIWALVHKSAVRAVNNARRKYLLSNEECEDSINSLVAEFAVRINDYRETDGAGVDKWLSYYMRLRLDDLVTQLRHAGLTGEIDDSLQLCDFDGPAPEPRGMGDPQYGKPGEAPPLLSEVLAHPATTQTVDEAAVDALLAQLGPDDAALLTDYYGLNGADPKTFDELAEQHGVASRGTVYKRLEKILAALRKQNP